jgi:hypothetical protein
MPAEFPKPKGPYTLWTDGGCEGWGFEDFETVKGALEAEKRWMRWVITRMVHYDVHETPPPQENAE